MAKLTLEEQETIIRFDRSSDYADIYTHEPKLIRKLLKLEQEHPDKVIAKKRGSDCVEYTLPKKCISINKPVTRKLSEEQRRKLSQRMKAINTAQGKKPQ